LLTRARRAHQCDDLRAAIDQRLQLARPWQRLDEVVAADQTARVSYQSASFSGWQPMA
jgi:hypothetical protein